MVGVPDMICSLFPVLQHSFTATINLHQIGHSGVRRAAVMARQVCAAEPDMACSLFQYWDDQLAPDETRNGTASVTQCVQLNQIWRPPKLSHFRAFVWPQRDNRATTQTHFISGK